MELLNGTITITQYEDLLELVNYYISKGLADHHFVRVYINKIPQAPRMVYEIKVESFEEEPN